MFLLSNIGGSVPNLFLSRAVSCSSCSNSRSHYITLGITPAASQEDIKKAYFELCKKYHPDKNDGSMESTKMFRIITEAYEVLGNEKLRLVYDEKMGFGRGMKTEKWKVNRPEDYSYEAERYFYERTKPRKTYTGKTWQFDFDAWTRAHYPKVNEEDLKNWRERRRNWKNIDPNVAAYPYKNRKRPQYLFFSLLVLSVIGFSIVIFPGPGYDNVRISTRIKYVDDDAEKGRT